MKIDLNADLGEGVGNEELLMPYLTSCNIACGGHAGNPELLTNTIRFARQHHVKIGAHPSFPDRKNFGRVEMEMPPDELTAEIIDQVQRVRGMVEAEGGMLHHIKPHGALYNMASVRADIANCVITAIKSIDVALLLYAPFGSVISRLAQESGIKIRYEVFADRNYNEDLSLVSRTLDHAMLTDPDEIIAHVRRMVTEHKVMTVAGNYQPIMADTVCVHGDNPAAIDIVKALYLALKD